MKFIANRQKRILAQTKQVFIILMKLWSLDKLDLKDHRPQNNRGYRYFLAVINNFSNFGGCIPLENKNAKTIKDSFENILLSSKKN